MRTSRRRWIAGAAGAVTVIGAIAALHLATAGRARGGRDEPHAPAALERGAAAGDDVSALRAEVRALEAMVLQRRAGVAEAASPTCNPGTVASSGEMPSFVETARERAGTEGERLDERLQSETRDPSWAPEYEETLRRATETAVGDPKAGSLTRAECRSTMCRLEVRHADTAQEDAFRTRFRVEVPDAAYRVSQLQNQDGSTTSVLHIIRKGYPIPHESAPL